MVGRLTCIGKVLLVLVRAGLWLLEVFVLDFDKLDHLGGCELRGIRGRSLLCGRGGECSGWVGFKGMKLSRSNLPVQGYGSCDSIRNFAEHGQWNLPGFLISWSGSCNPSRFLSADYLPYLTYGSLSQNTRQGECQSLLRQQQ